jgi:hypothetical protein
MRRHTPSFVERRRAVSTTVGFRAAALVSLSSRWAGTGMTRLNDQEKDAPLRLWTTDAFGAELVPAKTETSAGREKHMPQYHCVAETWRRARHFVQSRTGL